MLFLRKASCFTHSFSPDFAEPPVFPPFLEGYGLSEESLLDFIVSPEVSWQIPSTCLKSTFYYELHNYLKQSPRMKVFSKTSIGNLYIKIDPYISERKFRPDNAYRYVDRLICQSVPDVHVMHQDQYFSSPTSLYDVGVEDSVFSCEPPHFNGCPTAAAGCRPKKKPSYQPRNVDRREHRNKLQIKSLQQCIKEKSMEVRKLEKLVQKKDRVAQKLQEAVDTTTLDTTMKVTQKYQHSSQRKVQKLQRELDSVLSDLDALENSSETVQAENERLKSTIVAMQNEQETGNSIIVDTKCGKHYSPTVRKLYYALLANQVPAGRIRNIISTVLESHS